MSTSAVASEILGQVTAETSVLTVYLHVDQSQQQNLNRMFEVSLKNILREEGAEVPAEERVEFEAAAERIQAFIRHWKPEGRGLLLMAGHEGDVISRVMHVPVENLARWRNRPYLRPLLEHADEFEPALVLLVDRARARLFRLEMNALEELADYTAEHDVRQVTAPGMDHLWSEKDLQKRAAEHASMHLRNVAHELDQYIIQNGALRVLIAGTAVPASEIQEHFSDAVRRNVIGTASIPITANDREIVDQARAALEQTERENETVLVDTLMVNLGKERRGCRGWRDTADMALQQRLQTLIYCEPPYEDLEPSIGSALEYLREAGVALRGDSLEDLLGWLIEKAIEQDAEIEQVHDAASNRVRNECEGIGAILRY